MKNDERIKEICRLYKDGQTRKQISEKMFCSMSTVDRALHLYGETPVRNSFEDHRKEIIEMYESGAALRQISEETGISIKTINRHLLKMGMHRGKGWKSGHEKQDSRQPMSHREKREDDGEQDMLMPRRYADNTRRAIRVVIRGKVYQDVSAWYM